LSVLPAGSRFCSACGQPTDPESQLLTSPAAVVAVGVGRLVSTESIPVGGLTPGSVLADRYRIVGLLGRGGMGEVYRADDVKLGQTVALKFLPRELSTDPVARERFFAEVRITRQLSHPNICRVYDIAEFNGRHFLSMEFIDGEDLASLLKRIGYLSNEKALDIARQLAAGLATAHQRGVLHRDLKPANIMIDGHGRVRITDFGLAVATSSASLDGDVSGTPVYMAPEQLARKGASVRSDIYALGLVLYEACCGRKAFLAGTLAELRDEKERSVPRPPSELHPGVEPSLDRLIMRCLERDPHARPASVSQVAAALPGGDPLAAAIAAGETPSPELVAASGLKEGIAPPLAVGLLALTVVASLGAVSLGDKVNLAPTVKLSKSPGSLVERAHTVLRKAGYPDEAPDTGSGFFSDDQIRQWVFSERAPTERPDALRILGAVQFFYRQSPIPIVRPRALPTSSVDPGEPPLQREGDVEVRLNGDGLLRSFEAIPGHTATPRGDPDWAGLFGEAGLDWTKWAATEPQSVPPSYADARFAWEGSLSDTRARVEAASYEGRPVSFEIVGPWQSGATSLNTLSAGAEGYLSRATSVAPLLLLLVIALTLSGAVLARRNLRSGRGDRRGATRLAFIYMTISGIVWLLIEHHVRGLGEAVLVFTAVGGYLTLAAGLWMFYIAAEPFVRRRWPEMLVTWTRVLAGNWRDPLVGRDVLFGCASGALAACLTNIARLAALETRTGGLTAPDWNLFNGTAPFLGAVIGTLGVSVADSLPMLFTLCLARIVLRHERTADAIFVVIAGGPVASVGFSWVTIPALVATGLIRVLVLTRIGLVALIVGATVSAFFMSSPMTFQTSEWYAGPGYAAFFVIGALALFGFITSLGGRPILSTALAD
jgi:serine/threonine-protein kinase